MFGRSMCYIITIVKVECKINVTHNVANVTVEIISKIPIDVIR